VNVAFVVLLSPSVSLAVGVGVEAVAVEVESWLLVAEGNTPTPVVRTRKGSRVS
jgi:hypothetical protein